VSKLKAWQLFAAHDLVNPPDSDACTVTLGGCGHPKPCSCIGLTLWECGQPRAAHECQPDFGLEAINHLRGCKCQPLGHAFSNDQGGN